MPICPQCREENPELGAKCPRDGHYYIYDDAIDDAQQDAWLGTMAADKYVILSLISQGGMGAVYRAMQLPIQREVAFKVLRADLQDSDQGHDRFVREARAISKLSHPNIITMYDFGVTGDGHPYMVMEYVAGDNLADWMARPEATLDELLDVFCQILSALSEAHSRDVVHRDLKPENLVVTSTATDDNFVKLLDFGIARMVHDGAARRLTREGEVFGTPHYMAPEQAQGVTDIGPPADVYATGIILFELLAGRCPFNADTPLAILYMHINEHLPSLEPRGDLDVPAWLVDVLSRATAKDPDARYQTAGKMLAAVNTAAVDPTESTPSRSNSRDMSPQKHLAGASSGDVPDTGTRQSTDSDRPIEHTLRRRPPSTSEPPVAASTGPSAHPTAQGKHARKKTPRKAIIITVATAIVLGTAAVAVMTDDGTTSGIASSARSPNSSAESVRQPAHQSVTSAPSRADQPPPEATGAEEIRPTSPKRTTGNAHESQPDESGPTARQTTEIAATADSPTTTTPSPGEPTGSENNEDSSDLPVAPPSSESTRRPRSDPPRPSTTASGDDADPTAGDSAEDPSTTDDARDPAVAPKKFEPRPVPTTAPGADGPRKWK